MSGERQPSHGRLEETATVPAPESASRHRQTEQILEARLRLLSVETTCSLDGLLQTTLDEFEALTGSCVGFYHFVAPDQDTLYLQTWSTRTLARMCHAEGKGQHYPASMAGVWVDCLRARRPVIHNNYPSLPHKKGLPAGHVPIVRQLLVPLLRNDKVVAIMGVGNKPFDYDATDVAVAQLLGDFSYEIAERKRAELRLRDSLELNQQLVHASTHGIVVCHADGTPVLANRAAARLLGLAPDKLSAGNLREAPWWKQSRLLTVADQVLSDGRAQMLELAWHTSEETNRWLAISVSRFESNATQHLLLLLSDIGPQKIGTASPGEGESRTGTFKSGSGAVCLRGFS